MHTATVFSPEPFIVAAISETADLLSYSESIRLRSMLDIDLSLAVDVRDEITAADVEAAVARAVRQIGSHRLGYGSRPSDAQVADLEAIAETLAGLYEQVTGEVAPAATQFLLLADAAAALGVTATALRRAASRSRAGVDAGALYELDEWARIARSGGLVLA